MLSRHDWIRDMPDIANGGRVMNYLMPEATGWDEIGTYLEQDGVVALNAQPRNTIEKDALEAFGPAYDYPTWDVYMGTDEDILAQCRRFLGSHELPEGWRVACLDCPDDDTLEAIQTLNLETGVAPYPAFYARSEVVPSMTGCIWDDRGTLVATSSVNARYHPQSRFGNYVFKGSTSVAPDQRGKSLGKFVNAHVLIESHAAMGWTGAVSQVSATNVASQKTIAAAGFIRQPELMTLAIVAKGKTFTR